MNKLVSAPILILLLSLSSTNCKKNAGDQSSALDPSTRLQIFQATKQENLKPTIWDTGDTTITNEDRLDLFQSHVADLGGGYIGVGSTQNFSLAAWAKTEYMWLMDFTRVVVWANRVNIAFLKNAKTPAEFRELWDKKSEQKVYTILDKEYSNDPELNDYKKAWKISNPFQRQRFRIDDKIHAKRNTQLWLYSQPTYDHIRELAVQGKMIAVKGDLRGPTTVLSIAETARKMQIPIRVIYYSNAEEYFDLADDFRRNWLAVPVDEKSKIVRTISVHRNKFPWAEDSDFSTDRGFHYAIQPALNFQAWLKKAKPGLRTFKILQRGETSPEGFTMMNSLPLPEDIQETVSAEANSSQK